LIARATERNVAESLDIPASICAILQGEDKSQTTTERKNTMPQPTNAKEQTGPDEPKSDETPRERFVRLAELRVSNSLAAIRKLGLLGNKSQYEYTAEDIDKIDAAVTKAKDAALTALRTGKPTQSTFSL
jgi:hypothetical protein